jgi:hypothetical protein
MESRMRSITKSRKTRGPLRAFTLVEFSIAMGIAALILVITSGLLLYSGRTFASLASYVDMQGTALSAIDHMTAEIRQLRGLTSFSSNSLTFVGTNQPVTYDYSPTTHKLTRTEGSLKAQTFLRGCDFLEFKVFQRTPIQGTFNQNPIAFPEEAKVVTINWRCSRSLGNFSVTDTAQTAKVVLRSN